jgi:hypothetical protein
LFTAVLRLEWLKRRRRERKKRENFDWQQKWGKKLVFSLF